jgi:uncharacterized protein (DUF58 family)
MLALAAANGNLRVGAMIFSDKVEAYIPPQGGMKQAWEIVNRVANFEAKGASTDLSPALLSAAKELRSRAMVAVISDFIAPDFKNPLVALSARHDVRLFRVTDPAESAPLPKVGLVLVRDAETGEVRYVDTNDARFRTEHAALLARQESLRQAAFAAAKTEPLTLSTDGDPLETLAVSLSPKKK